MELNGFGAIVQEQWLRTAEVRRGIELDVFVVMPNHFHGILAIKDADNNVGQKQRLGSVLAQFKSIVTKRINILRSADRPVWQRNYYDHIIRNERELNIIRLYIRTNPILWHLDAENSSNSYSISAIKSVFRFEYGLNDDELELLVKYIEYRKLRHT